MLRIGHSSNLPFPYPINEIIQDPRPCKCWIIIAKVRKGYLYKKMIKISNPFNNTGRQVPKNIDDSWSSNSHSMQFKVTNRQSQKQVTDKEAYSTGPAI